MGLPISCKNVNSKKITILHTNDVHSHVEPFGPNEGKKSNKGGIARRAALIQNLRASNPNTLLFDAGDIFQGTPYFNYFTLEISKIDSIDKVSLKKIIDDYIKETGKSYGEVMIPLRIAVSGASGGPDLIGVLSTLGKPTIIERINDVKQKYLD